MGIIRLEELLLRSNALTRSTGSGARPEIDEHNIIAVIVERDRIAAGIGQGEICHGIPHDISGEGGHRQTQQYDY